VRRHITGFHQDDAGDWVAELSCLHPQHIRHRPPFQDRPWVLTEGGRREHAGTDIECPLCDRAELPVGLHVVRTAGPFNQDTIPAGLREDHRVAEGRWGCLRVIEGVVGFVMQTVPPLHLRLHVGERQPIPPGVTHHLEHRRAVVALRPEDIAPGHDAGEAVAGLAALAAVHHEELSRLRVRFESLWAELP
jgi:tellurite methyltransferase